MITLGQVKSENFESRTGTSLKCRLFQCVTRFQIVSSLIKPQNNGLCYQIRQRNTNVFYRSSFKWATSRFSDTDLFLFRFFKFPYFRVFFPDFQRRSPPLTPSSPFTTRTSTATRSSARGARSPEIRTISQPTARYCLFHCKLVTTYSTSSTIAIDI